MKLGAVVLNAIKNNNFPDEHKILGCTLDGTLLLLSMKFADTVTAQVIKNQDSTYSIIIYTTDDLCTICFQKYSDSETSVITRLQKLTTNAKQDIKTYIVNLTDSIDKLESISVLKDPNPLSQVWLYIINADPSLKLYYVIIEPAILLD